MTSGDRKLLVRRRGRGLQIGVPVAWSSTGIRIAKPHFTGSREPAGDVRGSIGLRATPNQPQMSTRRRGLVRRMSFEFDIRAAVPTSSIRVRSWEHRFERFRAVARDLADFALAAGLISDPALSRGWLLDRSGGRHRLLGELARRGADRTTSVKRQRSARPAETAEAGLPLAPSRSSSRSGLTRWSRAGTAPQGT